MKHLALTAMIMFVAFAGVTIVDARPASDRVATRELATARTSPAVIDAAHKPSGDVWLYAENLGEEVRVNIYKRDGSFDDAALAKLDELFRCTKTGTVRAVRAELYEKLSKIYDHFGGKRVDLISGFRFRDRSSSRHFHAAAMDIRVRGASLAAMHRYALSLDTGGKAEGMGIGLYRGSGFIHIDFRAPGEPSYRWTEGHGKKPSSSKPAAKPRTVPARRPTS
jgi:uncharacterized protein YcbK (DUF882 family)